MFTVDFLVTETIGQNAPQRAWVLNASYSFLKTPAEDWNAVLADIRERYGAYANAANDPHPKYGRGYPLGKVFASIVGARRT